MAHAAQHVYEVFGCEVSGRSGGVGTTAETTERRVEGANAGVEPRKYVGQSGPARVVHVQRQLFEGHIGLENLKQTPNIPGRRRADGISETDFVHPKTEKRLDERPDCTGGDRSFKGAVKRGGDVTTHSEVVGHRLVGHGLKDFQGFPDAFIDIFLVVGLGRRQKYGDFFEPGPKGTIQAFLVGHQGAVADSCSSGHGGGKDLMIRELRNPPRRDEAGQLDASKPRVCEAIRQGDLVGSGNEGGLVLEAISESHLINADVLLAAVRHWGSVAVRRSPSLTPESHTDEKRVKALPFCRRFDTAPGGWQSLSLSYIRAPKVSAKRGRNQKNMSELTCQEVFEKHIPERLAAKPEVVQQINNAYQFEITGDGGGSWVVDLTKTADFVSAGSIDEPGVTVTMTAKDFVALVEGKLNGQMAFMSGKLKIKGDMSLALKLQQILG